MSDEALVGLWEGVRQGWWEDVDEEALLPVRVFQRCDFHEYATWAHVWFRVGKFKSMKEAKRAGWNIPLSPGTKRIVRIEKAPADEAGTVGFDER